ncbi:MAG: hypothetical protein WDO18_14590 [Acidobacteriota bacterium]
MTTKNSVQESKTYTMNNVDAGRKTIIIEHPLRPGYTLVSEVKPKELTSTAQRFEVNLGGKASESFVVKEERVYDQTISVVNMTPDALGTWIQNRTLSAAGRTQFGENRREEARPGGESGADSGGAERSQQLQQ